MASLMKQIFYSVFLSKCEIYVLFGSEMDGNLHSNRESLLVDFVLK